MIELLLALLYLMLYSDTVYDFTKMQNLKNYKKRYKGEQITESDWDLMKKFLNTFSETELIRLNKIMNILQEKIDNF
jgi:hypothetical protein